MSENQREQLLRHADAVWRVVVRLLNDPEEARECYQQTFLEALQVPRNRVTNWGALLTRIGTCRAMDALRAKYRRRQFISDGIAVEPEHEMPPESDLQFEELRDCVRRVLATLPDQQAEAFVLRHLEQLTPTEIALQLGVSPANVRVLIHRALKALRDSLPNSFRPVSMTSDGESDE